MKWFLIGFSEDLIKSKHDSSAAIPTEECTPPSFVFLSEEQPATVEPLFPKDVAPKVRSLLYWFNFDYQQSWSPFISIKQNPIYVSCHVYLDLMKFISQLHELYLG